MPDTVLGPLKALVKDTIQQAQMARRYQEYCGITARYLSDLLNVLETLKARCLDEQEHQALERLALPVRECYVLTEECGRKRMPFLGAAEPLDGRFKQVTLELLDGVRQLSSPDIGLDGQQQPPSLHRQALATVEETSEGVLRSLDSQFRNLELQMGAAFHEISKKHDEQSTSSQAAGAKSSSILQLIPGWGNTNLTSQQDVLRVAPGFFDQPSSSSPAIRESQGRQDSADDPRKVTGHWLFNPSNAQQLSSPAAARRQEVHFTGFHPAALAPGCAGVARVFLHPADKGGLQLKDFLGLNVNTAMRPTKSAGELPSYSTDTVVRIIPRLGNGCRVKPKELLVEWSGDVTQCMFTVTPSEDSVGMIEGEMLLLVNDVARGEIPISLSLDVMAGRKLSSGPAPVSPFRQRSVVRRDQQPELGLINAHVTPTSAVKAAGEIFDYVVLVYAEEDRLIAAELKRQGQARHGFMVFENRAPQLDATRRGRCQLLWSLAAQESKQVVMSCQQFLGSGRSASDVWPCVWAEPIARLPEKLRRQSEPGSFGDFVIRIEEAKPKTLPLTVDASVGAALMQPSSVSRGGANSGRRGSTGSIAVNNHTKWGADLEYSSGTVNNGSTSCTIC